MQFQKFDFYLNEWVTVREEEEGDQVLLFWTMTTPHLEVIADPSNEPLADAGPDQRADANEFVLLDGSASVVPNGVETYTWTTRPEGQVVYSGSESTLQVLALGRAEEVYELTVTDKVGWISRDVVSIFNETALESGVQGPPGLEGPEGPQGPQGTPGDPGISPEALAALQRTVAENRMLLEQIPKLRKAIEDLQAVTTE